MAAVGTVVKEYNIITVNTENDKLFIETNFSLKAAKINAINAIK